MGLTRLSIRLRVNTWTTRQCRSRRIGVSQSQKQNKNKRKRHTVRISSL